MFHTHAATGKTFHFNIPAKAGMLAAAKIQFMNYVRFKRSMRQFVQNE